MSWVYNELKMQVFIKNTALLFKISATYFGHCFVAIIRLISSIYREENNTAAILVRDLGPYRFVYKVYNIHCMYIMKNKILGFKMYIYNFLCLYNCSCV